MELKSVTKIDDGNVSMYSEHSWHFPRKMINITILLTFRGEKIVQEN